MRFNSFLGIILFTALFVTDACSQKTRAIIDGRMGCLIGMVSEGLYSDADAAAEYVEGTETYYFYDLNGYLGNSTGTDMYRDEPPCEQTWFVDVPFNSDNYENFIGVQDNPDAYPDKLIVMSNDIKVYKDVVADLLKREGIKDPKVQLTQVIKTDLEGDGVDEVLITAASYENVFQQVKKGDYALVLLRKVVNGKVHNIPIVKEIITTDAQYAIPFQYEITAILDVDGDGSLEIFLRGYYYEGSGTDMLKVEGTNVIWVAGCGCGA